MSQSRDSSRSKRERRGESAERRHKQGRSGRRVGSRRQHSNMRQSLPAPVVVVLEILFVVLLVFGAWLIWVNYS